MGRELQESDCLDSFAWRLAQAGSSRLIAQSNSANTTRTVARPVRLEVYEGHMSLGGLIVQSPLQRVKGPEQLITVFVSCCNCLCFLNRLRVM